MVGGRNCAKQLRQWAVYFPDNLHEATQAEGSDRQEEINCIKQLRQRAVINKKSSDNATKAEVLAQAEILSEEEV